MTEPPDPDAFRRAREDGRRAAFDLLDAAPAEPLLRVAWAAGFGHPERLRAAIDEARTAGCTWKQIGAATDEHWRTAQSKYGPGYEAHRRYRERRRAAAGEE